MENEIKIELRIRGSKLSPQQLRDLIAANLAFKLDGKAEELFLDLDGQPGLSVDLNP